LQKAKKHEGCVWVPHQEKNAFLRHASGHELDRKIYWKLMYVQFVRVTVQLNPGVLGIGTDGYNNGYVCYDVTIIISHYIEINYINYNG